jgi:hypothetical protein
VSEFGGRIKTTERKGNHRTCYTWDLRGLDNIMNFVEAIGEYTLAKSSELAVLMEVCESMKLTGRQPLTEEELNNRLTASNKLKEMKREGNG